MKFQYNNARLWAGKPVFLMAVALIFTAVTSSSLEAQIRAGGSFLKVLPGARQHGMGSSLTGALDDIYSLYANPAASGFAREWQWSSTYTEWFADTYNASLTYSRRFKTPLSRHSHIALGIQHQGIREFDSTNNKESAASASDQLITVNFSSPISAISPLLSFGTNLKLLHSQLANLSASSWIFDFGMLYRTKRQKLDNPFFENAIFSFGAAITNLGAPLTFIDRSTPLPRTFRAGTAMNIGTHDGLQMQISADLHKVRDERLSFSLGSELSWSYRFSLRAGYHFNSKVLNRFSFGISFKLDDRFTPLTSLPGRNRAVRLDMAGLERSTPISSIYHVSAGLFPVAPETFELQQPRQGENVGQSSVKFAWSPSADPDLFDDVSYVLLLERHENLAEKTALSDFIKRCNTGCRNIKQLLQQEKSSFFLIRNLLFPGSGQSKEIGVVQKDLPRGEYYWTVLAIDKDEHSRFAGVDVGQLGHFSILPDLQITKVVFSPSKWITETDYQGELRISITNRGAAQAESSTIAIFDSLLQTAPQAGFYANGHTTKLNKTKIKVPELSAAAKTVISLPWHTAQHGLHQIVVVLDPGDSIHETDETNNRQIESFSTIPRGYFRTEKTAITQIDSLYEYELPFIPRVYFKPGSAAIQTFNSSLIYSPLKILTSRLKQHKAIRLKLQGSFDDTEGEPESLGVERALAVKQRLLDLGVEDARLQILRPMTPQQESTSPDSLKQAEQNWVLAEKRFVKITAHHQHSRDRQNAQLFFSVPVSLPKSKTPVPVLFTAQLTGFRALETAQANLHVDTLLCHKFALEYSEAKPDSFKWRLNDSQQKSLEDATINYTIELRDDLGRVFYSKSAQVRLKTRRKNLINKRVIIGVAEFRKQRPDGNLLWSNIVSRVNSCLDDEEIVTASLVGHACAIGDSSYNVKLSMARAKNFYQELIKRQPQLGKKMAGRFHKIGLRGLGESEPFAMLVSKQLFLETLNIHNQGELEEITYELLSGKKHNRDFPFSFRIKGDKILIQSDNETPFGRQMNRRIEIRLESAPETTQQEFTHIPR